MIKYIYIYIYILSNIWYSKLCNRWYDMDMDIINGGLNGKPNNMVRW